MTQQRLLVPLLVTALLALAGCSSTTADADPAGSPGPGSSGAAGTTTDPVERRPVTVTDETGRKVELDLPIQRAISGLGGNQYILENIRAVGGQDRIIGATASQIGTEGWDGYWDSFEALSDESNLVAGQTGGFDYDRIIELDPDVLLTGSNSPWQEAEEKLAPFGIKVLVFTAWEPRFSSHNNKLLGQLFGTEDQAERLETELTGAIEQLLTERLAGLKEEDKTRVYFEGATDYQAGVPGGWDWVIRYAGGRNIYYDIILNGGVGWNVADVEPADIVSRNPAFIIKNGVIGKPQGFYNPWDRSLFESTAEAIVARPGFSEIDAIREGNLWVTNNFLISAASKWVGALYLATWLYPERFEGVDPEVYFRAWVEEYQHSDFIDADQYFYHHDVAGGRS